MSDALKKYAEVLVRTGVNLLPGQGLHVTVPAEGWELARAVSEYAYSVGASSVVTRFTDERLDELDGAFANHEELISHVEAEFAEMTKLSQQDFAFLRLYSPCFLSTFEGREALQNQWNIRTGGIYSKLRGHTMAHGWTCIACCPTRRWAEQVFPGMEPEVALDKLWQLLLHITRSDTQEPVKGWTEHGIAIVEQGKKMTEAAFDTLHIVGPGTDLKIGLIPSHTWGGGRFLNNKGIYAVPNIPTEELASTPDRLRVDGIVSSVRPVNIFGEMVDEFWIRFEQGKAVEWDAAKGKDALTRLINHDEGSCYLGEVAIVPSGGLIGSTEVVYCCTLLDENATCHLALGAGFPMHIRDTAYHGMVNHSAMHVDFMIGNDKLCIYAADKNGNETTVFEYGRWTI